MFMIGMILTAFGLPFAVIMTANLKKISENPHLFRLADGISLSDAQTMISVCFLMVFVGIVLMVTSWIRCRNYVILQTIRNEEHQNYCSDCDINVVSYAQNCPICNKPLR